MIIPAKERLYDYPIGSRISARDGAVRSEFDPAGVAGPGAFPESWGAEPAAAIQRVRDYVNLGFGAVMGLVTGGASIVRGGRFFDPIPMVGTNPQLSFSREEISGLVTAVMIVDDLHDAIRMASGIENGAPRTTPPTTSPTLRSPPRRSIPACFPSTWARSERVRTCRPAV